MSIVIILKRVISKPQTMKHNSIVLPASTILILASFIMTTKVFAATGNLGLNDFQVPIGSSALVPITINVADGFIKDFAVTITYDESIVDVTADSNLILNPAFTGTVVADAGAGTSTITGTTATPMTGTLELADVRFSSVGVASGVSATVTVTPNSGSFLDDTSTVFSPEPTAVSATATIIDTTPDGFSFPAQINVPLSSLIDSAPITVTGIDVPTAISTSSGEYSINGGTFTSAPGTVINGDTVVFRIMSSDQYSTATSGFLRIGLSSDDFRVTTISDPAIDTTPDGFSFVNQFNVPLNSPIDSAPILVSGINAPAPITVTGGQYSINGGTFTADQGTVENGSSVIVRLQSSEIFATQTIAVLRVGGAVAVSDDFRVTTLAEDTTPDLFNLVDQVDVAVSSPIISAPIIVAGINSPASISIIGGEYEINGSGTFTAEPGTVNLNDSVVVRVTSAADFSTPTDATLTIGGVSDIFTVTTLADPTDTVPDQFTFVDQVDVERNTLINSEPIVISGISIPTAITIAGGEYEINGSGTFTADPGTIENGNTVIVRQTSSANFSTPTDVTLTIGGVSDIFTVTTIIEDTTPELFSLVDQVDVATSSPITSEPVIVSGINSPAAISIVGGEYEINGSGTFTAEPGTVNLNDSVVVRVTSAADFSTPTDATLTIGGVSDVFTATTAAMDSIPEAFTFTDQFDVIQSSPITSEPVIVSGINSPAAISIVGGEYEINGSGTFTTEPGTVNLNDSVVVRVTSAADFSTPTDATLIIGGVSDIFTVTTLTDPTDTVPDQFIFVDQVDIERNTQLSSNSITITGIGAPVSITIAGGEYEINGSGTFTADAGTVESGDTVIVRQTSSASFATPTDVTLTVGGVSDVFTLTTLVEDTTPEPFTFTDQTDVALSTIVVSDQITVTGINSLAPISIIAGEYEINGSGTFTTEAGTVNVNDVIVVRQTSSASFSTSTAATLIIGGISDNFDVTTLADPSDIIPDPFSFIDQVDVAINTQIESAPVTITGINQLTAISITGGEYAINGGAFTSADGTIENDQTVVVRISSSTEFATSSIATLTVGGVSDDFSVTTLQADDTTPDAFAFASLTNVPLISVQTSNMITVSGINAPSSISISAGEYSINGTAFTSDAGTVSAGDEVVIRQTSSTEFQTETITILTIGGVSENFSVTTAAAPENNAPLLQAISDQNATVDSLLTFTASASDADGDTLTFALGSNAPTGAVIDAASGEFSWTPTQAGTFTFDLTVSDGTLSDTQTITIIVTLTSQPIVTPTIGIAAAADDDDSCGNVCEKYKKYRREFKSDENKEIYMYFKTMQNSDPATFQRFENIYLTYRDLSKRELKTLSQQTQDDFRQFNKYRGYKHYRSLKDRA